MRSLVLTAFILMVALPGGTEGQQSSFKGVLARFQKVLGDARSAAASLADSEALNPKKAAVPNLNPALEVERQRLRMQLAEIDKIQTDFRRAYDYLDKVGGYCNSDNLNQVEKSRDIMAQAVVRSGKWGRNLVEFGTKASLRIDMARSQLGLEHKSQSVRVKTRIIPLLKSTAEKIGSDLDFEASQQSLSYLHRLNSFCNAIKPSPAPPKDPLGRKKASGSSKAGTTYNP